MSKQSEAAERSRATPAAIACTGKVSFPNHGLATSVANRKQDNGSRRGRSAYHCGHCGLWHIGTDSGNVAKQRARDFQHQKESSL